MKIWNLAPLVRLFIPFLTGIIAAVYFPFQFDYLFFLIISLTLIISAIVLIPALTISYKRSWWFGILLNATLFTTAYELSILKTEKFDADHFSKSTATTSYVYARLKEPYLEKENTLKAVMEILAVKKGNEWKSTSGKAMIYFQKDARSLQLNYGDELFLKANFVEVPQPQNPGEYNYKRFLAFHNIYQQAYIKENDWMHTGNNSANGFIKYCLDLRNSLLKILTDNQVNGDEFSVGAALLLGYEDRLDADIISAYANTGALHVLSVSGLHVAIVYIVFSWLLFFLGKVKYGHIIKAILLILFLWFYAALTGLSPSVLRSAAMFSFIVIAKAFNRYTNIYNTLAASAFLLLIIDPYLVMDVGFQLSYLAVIGIVFIQPKIYDWFEIDNRMLDEIWKITTVSIAAQIATFPLGLLYFHQFPNYFLLSNFIVIPVSTLIIYTGIALFLFAKVSVAATYLAMGFNCCVWFLNASVKTMEQWPCALLKGISITGFETALIYLLIILFFYYFNKQKFIYLAGAFCIFIVILCSQVIEQHQQFEQKKLIVYNIPKTNAIDFITAKSNVLLTNKTFATNEYGLLFHIKHNWWDLGINDTKIISDSIRTKNLWVKNNVIRFYDKRIIIVNDNKLFSETLPVDLLIISNNPSVHISDILKKYHPNKIIFDSSNYSYRVTKWKKECALIHQPYYSVPDEGALVVNL